MSQTPLYKTTIVIWSEYNPDDIALEELAQDARTGESYCSKQDTVWVEHPEADADWDDTEFFKSDFDEEDFTP